MSEVTVLLVDDHRVIRSGLRMLLESAGGLAVVGEAGTLGEAITLVGTQPADVVVLDLQLGGESGLKLMQPIREQQPEARVVVLTMHENDEYLWAALKAGASGYVLKRSADVDLVTAIHTAMAGGTYVDGTLASVLVGGEPAQAPAHEVEGARDDVGMLSERELQVAYRVALGHTNAEIGKDLYLSVKTVETYRSRAMAKLGLETRAALVRYALEHGWFAESNTYGEQA